MPPHDCRRHFLYMNTLISDLILHTHSHSHSHYTHSPVNSMEDPKGTILFTTVGRPHYGFDVFSVKISPDLLFTPTSENRLTDGVSINFNAQFVDTQQSLVFVSERTGSSRIYLTQLISKPKQLPSAPASLFHDRPIIKNQRLYFISAHEQPDQPFKSWCALYSTALDDFHDDDVGNGKENIVRLTPHGVVDYSPAISQSGDLIAVASYGSRPWGGEFHELHTDIVVFKQSDPTNRMVACERGGWPTWSGDSSIYFHRQADDGWWSIFRIDFPSSGLTKAPLRVTPAGVHCFTPAAMHDCKRIVVATRRRGKDFRHIEIFDTESGTFYPVSESLNPNMHHYNPFVSPDSEFLGYHRFRGESQSASAQLQGDSTVPHLEPVVSPINGLRMLRLNGAFPASSPDGDLIAFNRDLDLNPNSGVMIVTSDGYKRWTLLEGRTAFCNTWSPTEKHVIYTSVGPIFHPAKTTVQIARLSYDQSHLDDGDRERIPSNLKILTREETGNNAFPSCSPDGKCIVFRSGRSGHKNLYLLDAVNGEFDGGYIRQLTEGPWIDTMPSWSPKGDLIAFSSNMHNPENDLAFSIYVIKPDGSDLRRIHVAERDVDRERINHVCFSRDGEWLLFTANLDGVTAEPVSWPNQYQPYGDLYVVRLDGSGLRRRLTWNGYENGTPVWHSVEHLDLHLGGEIGERLRGEFDEPLWISCNI